MGISAPRQSAGIGARRGSLLLRVGKDNEAWAYQIPGVATAIMGGRRISGWVRATPEAYGNDAVRQKLIARSPRLHRLTSQKEEAVKPRRRHENVVG